MRRAFEFVGVDCEFKVPQLVVKNKGTYGREILKSLLDDLRVYFKPHNEQLEKRLCVDTG